MSAVTVDGRTLDRLELFDPRSLGFGVAAELPRGESTSLRSYTWSCGWWYDQGREGACVAFACAHEMSARPAVVGPLEASRIRGWYHAMQRIDPWPGGAYPGADPFYEGTSVLAGAKLGQQLGAWTGYRWALSLHDALAAIGYLGPVVLGIPWYEGMMRPDAAGVIRPTGEVVGGHAIVARGVSVRSRYVRLRNSWGRGYGSDGDVFLSFADLERLLGERGECMVPTGRRVVAFT